MQKKLSSLYCTFVSCKSFVSDFFIVEKTFAFYEKFLFSEEKTFAIFRFTIFEGRNFCENGQKSRKSRKFLPAKVSAPKVMRSKNLCIISYSRLFFAVCMFQLVACEKSRTVAGDRTKPSSQGKSTGPSF